MDYRTVVVPDDVKTRFQEFRNNKSEQLRVKVRQARASEIRLLLSQPEWVDITTFNRDVWAYESQTLFNGQPIPNFYDNIPALPPDLRSRIDKALEVGTLAQDGIVDDHIELHGNYVWKSGSSVFSPRAKDDAEREDALQRALVFLNDAYLTLAQKAEQINQLPGFGNNITTGLLMLCHDTEFALYNNPSRAAMQKLGFDVDTLEEFQQAARSLRIELDATDFLELDWFLYLENSRSAEVPAVHSTDPVSVTATVLQPPRMVKVAPGFNANFWQDCLQGGYICVGWDGLGDLENYPTEADFRKAFEQIHPYKNNLGKPSRSKMSAKANELWKFRTLKPGDLVAANDGASKILGVGTVLEPGYEYRPDRPAFHQTVRVRWDTSPAGPIPKQGDWPLKTVSEISPALAQFILSGTPLPPAPVTPPTPPVPEPSLIPPPIDATPDYQEPDFPQIEADIAGLGLRLDDGLLRRYHLALKTRGFVILSGISGTGKTWLAEAYAQSVGAECALVPVAPNWTTNEDLLGYLNPLSGRYHDTDFSRFLRRASHEYHRAQSAGQTPRPFHVILDEMNLARVEYYFAKFLSLMEQRARRGHVPLDLGDERLTLSPNLVFVGTVNSDETTHGFADKVYDRAQLLELTAPRQALSDHIGDTPHRDALLAVWDAIAPVAPFAFRVVDEIRAYIAEASIIGVAWQEALDDQLLQKVLPKVKGTDLRLGLALQHLAGLPAADFPRTIAKAAIMHQGFSHHGFASFF